MNDTMQLTEMQKCAISEIDHNLQIVACAGSGKTEVISRRVANILQTRSEVLPSQIVVFTFSEKAAFSLQKRIVKALGEEYPNSIDDMYVGTIHGFCCHILKQYTKHYPEHIILDTVTRHHFVTQYHKECGMRDLGLNLLTRNINLFISCIDKMIYDYDNRETWPKLHRNVLDTYIKCLDHHGYLDFSLLLLFALQQMRTNDSVQSFLSQIQYLMVDEYEEVDDLQEQVISLISKNGANICVAGNDDQTIYQFLGSNADHMISFSERYMDVRQICLNQNFRCAPDIVDVANCVIGKNVNRIEKKMISGIENMDSQIQAIRYDSAEEQYKGIAETIMGLHSSGVLWKDIAILNRKSKNVSVIAAELKKLGIPCETEEVYGCYPFEKDKSSEDAVQVMTIHKAKNLEFHTVFLPGMEHREFPFSYRGGKQYWHILGGAFAENKDKYRGSMEDERKLFYVAITRAKQNLYLQHDQSKHRVSVFVEEAAQSTKLHIHNGSLQFFKRQSN